MSKVKTLFWLFVFGGILVFSSCDDGGEVQVPKKTGIIIVNEGNFGAGNGSLSFYDEELMTISNNLIRSANGGAAIGSLVQSVYLHDGVGYILCNDANKIEFIDQESFGFLANPLDEVNVPRYMTVVGNKGYISCWGSYDANYALPDSYIAVMDLATKSIIDTLECGSGPEGIFASGNTLFVANSFETTVSVIDLSSGSSSKIEFEAAPQHFVQDAAGNLWVSLVSGWAYPAAKAGIQAINIASLEKGTFVPVLNVKGSLAIDSESENIYVLTAEAYPKTGTTVQKYNTITKSLGTNPIVSGDNFYGIGYNITTDKLYVADNLAFSGNGKITVYNQDGTLFDEQVAGIGPNGFVLK
jgi:hypothetical protein